VSRVPIRLRLTLAFAVVMAVVLGAAGLFLYSQQRIQLNKSIDQTLRTERDELKALLRTGGGTLGSIGRRAVAVPTEESSQVLTVSGRVVDGTRGLRRGALLGGSELARAGRQRIFAERNAVPGIEGAARLLAEPVTIGGRRLIIVAAKGVDDRDEDLASLADQLAILGPIALLLASLAGFVVIAFALRPVEQMRRRERQFVEDASHELRTPLATHKAELELALAYAENEQELRAAIRSGIEEVDRLTALAEDLLVIAQVDEGRLSLKREQVEVGGMFASLSERFSARAEQAGRPLLTESADSLRVNGDREHLEQALGGLLDNALRHGDGEIRLWARRNGKEVELHVIDGGPGFPPEFLPHAFERFRRADGSRGEGGSGLGLAIVEAIAVAHGGRARAANTSGGGADVWIEVPLRP
jgi:signal transduction histidine kinase